MASTSPVIVFLAGAFAEPSCFDTLAQHFRDVGYDIVYASYPSLNPSDPSSVTTAIDGETVRVNTLLPLIEQGRDVILFVHSYGGVVGGQAAVGLSKTSRARQGEPGGVIGLLYLVGNVVNEGESLLEAIGSAYPPFIKEHNPSKGLAVIAPVMETLYGGENPSLPKEQLEDGMLPHALAAFETPATAAAWAEDAFDDRRAYIRTLNDQCNPTVIQDIWIEKTKKRWFVESLESPHCPFISMPEKVAQVALDLMKKFA